MTEKITIVTHSSSFHTDDVFAVATLLLVLGDGVDVSVVRSRDMDIIKKGDYVVDVGGIYDPKINRFDHHQEGGAGVRPNSVPYAAFGLVWKTFGEKLVGSFAGADRIDKLIVQPIDAGDNGIQFLETKITDLHPLDIGLLTSIFIASYLSFMTIQVSLVDYFQRSAVSYAKVIMSRAITSVRDELEAEQYVLDSYNKAEDKRLIETKDGYPWSEVLSKFPEPLFVIYENKDKNWSIKNIRSDLFSFEPRKKLPESWAGKRNEELEKITGVTGSIFCHSARFLVVAKTKEAILKLAKIALES